VRLVQVASNPHVVDDAYHATPGSFGYSFAAVEAVVDAGEKVIGGTTFTENVDWLARELRGFRACAVHAETRD